MWLRSGDGNLGTSVARTIKGESARYTAAMIGREGSAPAASTAPARMVTSLPGDADWLPARLGGLSDFRLVSVFAALLFLLAAWPLLLVTLPPFQDLPNHVATAHIIAHPDLYPQYVFNGFFKSNGLLTLCLAAWTSLAGDHGLFAAARAFTAVVLAVNAVAWPLFVLRLAGRRHVASAALLVWPLVHGFFVVMGMLNFAFAFGLSLILLAVLERQRADPTVVRGSVIAALAGLLWFAHPLPLAVVGALVALHALRAPGWPARLAAARGLLLPLVPAVVLSAVAAERHLVKDAHTTASTALSFSYLNPFEMVEHLWLDASGALTRWGSMTIVPLALLACFAWRRRAVERAFFSRAALAALAAGYVALPETLSNWSYFHCRLVPFLWAGLALRLPARLPRAVTGVLITCALAFSVVTGVDYVRLARDQAAFSAGIDAVPARATLLPLLFRKSATSDFTESLTHAWADYVIAKDTSAPLVFAVERSYPITYRVFPPRALIPPALESFAERSGTPARLCQAMGQPSSDPTCGAAWRAMWADFWRQAAPRFTHVLAWGMTDQARALVPSAYRRTFQAGPLEIFARPAGSGDSGHPP